ncbi:neurofilament medium polypeptide, partial [Esox lucius]
MTAKHRGKKNKPNHEDLNNFTNESSEPEARGGHQYALLLILYLLIVVGGATASWFCFQQHQTITYLSDNIMGMQMKIVKLQSFQEEIRQTNEKQQSTDGFERRLNALEESYALAQKQVGMALTTAEQLKTSDLPAQVLSLHTEMNTRLAEMQHTTVSVEELTQIQAMLKESSKEFEAVRLQVEGLAGVSTELAQSMEDLTERLAEADAKLEDKAGLLGALRNTMEDQASELLRLKEQLSAHQAELDSNAAEITSVRELIEIEQSQRAQKASLEEQMVTVQQSLQEQNLVARSLHSELGTQLKAVQKRVAQLEGGVQGDESVEKEEAPMLEVVEVASATEEEDEDEAAEVEEVAAAEEEEDEVAPAAAEEDE